jgi:hypothetical protein
MELQTIYMTHSGLKTGSHGVLKAFVRIIHGEIFKEKLNIPAVTVHISL